MTKTYLCIGAGPGIGLATARRFATEGYRIVLASRDPDRLSGHASTLADLAANVSIRSVDAADPQAVAALVAGMGTEIDVLHYNAGVLHYGPTGNLLARTLDDESTDTLISDTAINVTSALAAIKAASAAMSARRSGTMLLTGGGLGVAPSGSYLTLSVGKAAVRAAALALFEPMQQQGLHLATVTVARLVAAGSRESVEIAEAFWQLHAQQPGAWTAEASYS